MNARLPGILLSVLVALAGSLAGCGENGDGQKIVVYTSLDEHYSKPILESFFRETGIQVLARYDSEADKTTGLYLRLISEKNRPRADVFWNSEVLRTVSLAEKNVLAVFLPKAAAAFPAGVRDPGGRWSGFAARARVLLYNTELVSPENAPRSILDLARPRFKNRAALALPLFGTTATHAGALRAVLGKRAMEDLFLSFKKNGVRVVSGNAVVRSLVASGDVALGLTDTDDANEAVRAGRPVAIVFPDQEVPFPGRNSPLGTFLIPNTVGLVAGGPNPEAGGKLIEYLLSASVEEMLARSGSAQIPLRPGLSAPPELVIPEGLRSMEVNFADAARGLTEAEPFLRELFVQ